MSDIKPIARAIRDEVIGAEGLTLSDLSLTSKWRVFAGHDDVKPGTSNSSDEGLVWSVSPDEWTVLGGRPADKEVVDLTHVRAMFRLTGINAVAVLSRICTLDLSDGMFPDGAAGRTLVAGVATELVRNDSEGLPSYLIVPSRSFGTYLHGVLIDAGMEFGLT